MKIKLTETELFSIEPSWEALLSEELQMPYVTELIDFLKDEYSGPIPIYPPKEKIFNALWKSPFESTQVVIIGQDPYHGPNQAHGLCFSVLPGVPFPPSLKNIFKELHSDLDIPFPADGNLERWAEQGVLLLNTVLTVREGQAFSHQGYGWERFTDAIVAKLGERENPPIFILWGKAAQDKCLKLQKKGSLSPDLFIMSAHPSPLSVYRGFYGSCPFSRANAVLTSLGKTPINW